MKKFTYYFTLLLGLLIISCTEDTPEVLAPTANFTFELQGKQVIFTSTSTDASTYAWDFGDTNTSTDENPTHTYDANGSYIAKLTVTNDTGSDSKSEVLEIINITIDGDFSDWADITASITGDDVSGTITSVKFENLDNNKLYIYVEGTDELTSLTQIYLDTDNDNTTGAQIDWQYLMGGEDVLIEGSFIPGDDQAGSIYHCEPCDGSAPTMWNWAADPINTNIADFIVASDMVSIPGGLAYEIAIDLTAMGKTIDADGIGIAVADMSLATWGPVGAAPKFFEATENPEGTLFKYTF